MNSTRCPSISCHCGLARAQWPVRVTCSAARRYNTGRCDTKGVPPSCDTRVPNALYAARRSSAAGSLELNACGIYMVSKCYLGGESLEIKRKVNPLNFGPTHASNPMRIEAHTI